jgi:uncharacterized phage protein (TIGR01671 family)
MEREIKFRAWDKKRKIMYPTNDIWSSPFIRFDGQVLHKQYSPMGGDGDIDDVTGEWILMQYSGLKDKNGVEIYEGDILKQRNIVLPVIHEDGCFGRRGGLSNCVHLDQFTASECEVIGNIHKHPELLQKQ